MPQAYSENLRQAMDTLRTHKLRSALTIFGVVLGVSVDLFKRWSSPQTSAKP